MEEGFISKLINTFVGKLTPWGRETPTTIVNPDDPEQVEVVYNLIIGYNAFDYLLALGIMLILFDLVAEMIRGFIKVFK